MTKREGIHNIYHNPREFNVYVTPAMKIALLKPIA